MFPQEGPTAQNCSATDNDCCSESVANLEDNDQDGVKKCAGDCADDDAVTDMFGVPVPPGGALAYMTCSLLRAENQLQTASFLQRMPGFTPMTERLFTPLDASDGFYLCLMQRR